MSVIHFHILPQPKKLKSHWNNKGLTFQASCIFAFSNQMSSDHKHNSHQWLCYTQYILYAAGFVTNLLTGRDELSPTEALSYMTFEAFL